MTIEACTNIQKRLKYAQAFEVNSLVQSRISSYLRQLIIERTQSFVHLEINPLIKRVVKLVKLSALAA